MSLFNPIALKSKHADTKEAKVSKASSTQYARAILASAESREAMEAMIGELDHDQVIKFYTRGAWSMHQLLEYVLLQTGPANVTFSTWTISEDPARKMFELKQAGIIKSLRALIDFRIRQRHPQPYQLLESICDQIKLGKCHAKITIIENETWSVSIVGSANYSRNHRLEAGTIFTRKADVVFDRIMLLNEINATDE